MKHERSDWLKERAGSKKKPVPAKKNAALFLTVMACAVVFAVLPPRVVQAEETDAGGSSYAQKNGTMSENSTEPEPPPQDTVEPDNGGTSDGGGSGQKNQNPLRITAHPRDVSVEAGDSAYFSVAAAGDNLTYQWYVEKRDGSGFQKINGATEALYCVMVFDGSMNGYAYKCRVKSNKNQEEKGSGGQGNNKNEEFSLAARLTVFYRVVSGARSVWVKSSGRGLVFQGSGPYSRFSGVSVDGGRIGADGYNKGGSQTPFTEITLLRSYLETLAEGDHEIEIVWSDGSAKSSFRIELPASDLPAGASGLGRTGADTEGSSRAAGKTAAALAAATGTSNLPDTRQADGKPAADEEGGHGQVSQNATEASLSENALKPSSDTAADVLESAGIPAGAPWQEMKVTPGERRTQGHSDFEKSPVRLAAVSGTAGRYAGTICMAVILISAAGIASGLLAYRLHDLEGRRK